MSTCRSNTFPIQCSRRCGAKRHRSTFAILSSAFARAFPASRCERPSSRDFRARPGRTSRRCCSSSRKRASNAWAFSSTPRKKAPAPPSVTAISPRAQRKRAGKKRWHLQRRIALEQTTAAWSEKKFAFWWKRREQARSEGDAPEVDARVFVPTGLPVGEFAEVKIVAANEYDLVANS